MKDFEKHIETVNLKMQELNELTEKVKNDLISKTNDSDKEYLTSMLEDAKQGKIPDITELNKRYANRSNNTK